MTFRAIIAIVRHTSELIRPRIIRVPIMHEGVVKFLDSCVLMICCTLFGLFENVTRYTLKECVLRRVI
jgi:hypothetical protein